MAQPVYSVLLYGGEEKLALPVIRSLGQQLGVSIHLATRHTTNVCYSRYLQSFHQLTEANHFQQLKRIISTTRADVLLPVDELATRFVIQHQTNFGKYVALPPLPDPEIFELVINKESLNNWLQDNNFPFAHFKLLDDNRSATDFRDWTYPLLLKPIWDGGGDRGGKNVRLMESYSQLERFLRRTNPVSGSYLVQEYIPGYDIDCSLLSNQGKLLAYTIQKGFITSQLQYSPGIELLDEPALRDQLEFMISALDWSGIAHLDFRYDQRDGSFKLVDFNARYWTTLLGSLAGGINFPDLACQTALGQTYALPSYSDTRFVLGQAALKNILPISHTKKTYSFNQTGLYFSLRDPMPDLLKSWYRLLSLISSLYRGDTLDQVHVKRTLSDQNEVIY